MGDTGDYFRAVKADTKRLKDKYGVECAQCRKARPKGQPKILLPGHGCAYGHRDPRPLLTRQQEEEA